MRCHQTTRVRDTPGGCARRSPGTSSWDGGSSPPTSTKSRRSLTCGFSYLDDHGALWGRSGAVRAAAKWSKATGATGADYVGLRIQ